LVASKIWFGDLAAMPLPEDDEPPQPPRTAARASTARREGFVGLRIGQA
jgi:hypothetical protein